jgi:hypothetical protein
MKKAILILALLTGSITAFAQGKVSLQMDLPIQFGPAYGMFAVDVAFANQVVPNNGNILPSHTVLEVGLYGGTSPNSLSLQGTSILNPLGGNGTPDGFFPITHIVTTLPGGVASFFEVKIWDSAYATYEAQMAAGRDDYAAFNNIFTMTPGTSIAYPSIINGGGTTWAAVGNEDVNALLVGGYGPWPEPPTSALFAVGLVIMLLSRRWKNALNN